MGDKEGIKRVVEAAARVAEGNWGFVSPGKDLEEIKEKIKEYAEGKDLGKIERKIKEYLRLGRRFSIETEDQLRQVFKEYMQSDNELGLQYDENIDEYYFESVIKGKRRDIRKRMGEELKLVMNSEVADKLNVSKDQAKIILRVLKGTEEFKDLSVIEDEELISMIKEIAYEDGEMAVYMNDFIEKMKKKFDNILLGDIENFYERNKEKLLKRGVHIYREKEIEEKLRKILERREDALFTVGNEGISQALINLMFDKGFVLKVIERGIYLPIHESLREESIRKFADSFVRSIIDVVKEEFEEKNYVMTGGTLSFILEEKLDRAYKLEGKVKEDVEKVKEGILRRVRERIIEDLGLKREGDVLSMEKQFNDKIKKVEESIYKMIVDEIKVAISLEDLESRIKSLIDDKVNEIWDRSCFDYVKKHLKTEEICSLCEDELKNRGWTWKDSFLISPETDKYEKEIMEEIKEMGLTGSTKEVIGRIEKKLEELIGEKYEKLNDTSKKTLKKFVLEQLKSKWR